MAGEPPARRVDVARGRAEIVGLLTEFPRQYAALESAMAAFGENFPLPAFKAAFDERQDMAAYNDAQALERAAGRVQNFVADLGRAGVTLARLALPPMAVDGSAAQQAFEALRDAGVIAPALCRRLTRAQRARTRIEHSYIAVPAGDVHRAVVLIHGSSLEFIARYRGWIEPYLD